jgi:prepilin signal peptidase PulO-like enzyme (type II secretory pathway)
MLVELATGLVWFGYWLAYFKAGVRPGADHPGVYLAHMALVSALIVSGVIDYERKEIFTSVTNVALAVGLAGSFIWPDVQRLGAYDYTLPDWTTWDRTDAVVLGLVGAAVGVGLINVTRFLGTLAFRREAMGSGDAYLMAAIGGVLGWEAAILVFFAAPFVALPYGFWRALKARGEAQGKGEEEPQDEGPPPAKVDYRTFLTTVAGLAMLIAAGLGHGSEWGTAWRLLVAAGLVTMGVSFRLLGREEDSQGAPGPREEEQTPQDEAREVPFGPFLGIAAGVVMLAQAHVVDYFLPGVKAMWHLLT